MTLPLPTDTPEAGRLSDEDLILNRNKKSITLNLRTEEARQVFYQLSEKVDVILESYRPVITKRIGIDYATIKKTNPLKIYCSLRIRTAGSDFKGVARQRLQRCLFHRQK
jgi:crotonobetainyl-CoA:carnitine CoA-transferase CaiB-like acyl-CoA transferase